MIEPLEARAIEEKREKRQKTADKLVERQNRGRPLRRISGSTRSLSQKDELQLRPKPPNRQQEDRRADQPCDMIGHLQLSRSSLELWKELCRRAACLLTQGFQRTTFD